MKNYAFRLAALVFCLLLSASVGLADKGKKAVPSGASPTKQKLKESDKKQQPEPSTQAVTPAVGITPAQPQQRQFQPAPSAPKAGEEIDWEVISLGGTDGSSASYFLGGTVLQTAIGSGSSVSYQLSHGYWQSFGECPGRGDPSGDDLIDVGDVMFLINYLFTGTSAPDPMCNGDANCDGAVDVGDVMYLINYLFTGTSPPGC